jgi:di/tricarboxylate transporter
MPPMELTLDMILVFAVIAAVIFLFIVEWVRVDVVAIMVMVALPLMGLIDGREAFSGFGSTAVISIIAVIIMGRGLDHTGVIGRVVRPLLKLAGTSHTGIVTTLSTTIAVISSVMQNIGAAALFLPALRRISRETGLCLSQLLMPVGAAAILGGTITLVGSSPLIMLNDLLAHHDLPPFSLFAVTPVGLALVAVGIVYFLLFSKRLLPHIDEGTKASSCGLPEEVEYYSEIGELFELTLPPHARITPSVNELCDGFSVHTVALKKREARTALLPPERDAVITQGTTIAVFGPRTQVEEASLTFGFELRDKLRVFDEPLSSEFSGVVEAVVSPHSKFMGMTLGEIHFRHNYLLTPLAVFREEKAYYSSLADLRLKPGDAILMHGAWASLQQFRQARDLIFSHSLDHEILHPHKAGLAMACFGLASALVLFTNLSLPVCLMTGALGMLLTRVLTIDEAYRGVDWRTIFLLAGLIPLGLATQKTGAATWLAQHIVDWLQQPPELVLLLVVGLLSTVFTLVASNVGATVLLVPLVISLAQSSGADPRLAALVVGLAASNSFMLPTHQVNALYMGPGRYTSRDYLRAGTPLSVIFLIVMSVVVYLFY